MKYTLLMALMMLASLAECVEINVFPFGEIVNGAKTDKIIEPLKHYRSSDTLSIDVATQGSERIVTFTGRQWYVNGDTVIQEMKFNGDKIINLIKYNESGYYESWQKATNEAMVHRIGLRCDNSMTWHSELIISNKLCKMIEIEEHNQDGIKWKSIALSDGGLIMSKICSLRYK